MRRTIILTILDGWGVGESHERNPIFKAHPETLEMLGEKYPMTSLQASGISVGLPWGEPGNSEVGHLSLGAGKVIYQYYPKITMAIQDGSFYENAALKSCFDHARKNNSRVHILGLISKTNTHSSLEHLDALLKMAEREKISEIKIHLFSDGKDSAPRSLEDLLSKLPPGSLASITGRYYAMDNNKNWTLTQKSFECLTGRGGELISFSDLGARLQNLYAKNMSEEFLPPLRLDPEGHVQDNDAVIFFNFREDEMRQLGESFVSDENSFSQFPRILPKNLCVSFFTRYLPESSALIAFPADTVENPLGMIISDAQKNQLRIAETSKYAHVTYFFNGHKDQPFPNEYRVLIPSLSTPRLEDHPELMAGQITDRVVEAIQNRAFDLIVVNYANGDAMAHTGNYQASVRAVEVIDQEIKKIFQAAEAADAILLITSDHGNVERVLNPQSGLPETHHDTSPVPFYLVAKEFMGKKFPNRERLQEEPLGILADVAPTILELLAIDQPLEMTGRSLIQDIY